MAKDHGKSIRDDEQYETLRDDGMSKQKAARHAIGQVGEHCGAVAGHAVLVYGRRLLRARSGDRKRVVCVEASGNVTSGRRTNPEPVRARVRGRVCPG